MGDDGLERAAVVALEAALEGYKAGRFSTGSQQAELLFYLQTDADGNAHPLLGQKTTAAPPAQGRIVADVGPVKDAEFSPGKLDQAVFLRFRPSAMGVR